MELRQLRYFVALYEERSVTKAAQRLNIVQPAVSQQLAKLEALLDQPLFHRTSRGMVATPAGDEAYRKVVPILRDLDDLREALRVERGAVKGHLSVGAISSIANNALSETLRAFNEKYPQVTVRATGGLTPNLLEMLRTAQIDVAVVNAPSGRSEFAHVDIVSEDFALVAAFDNRNAPRRPAALVEVAELDLVIPSKRHGLRHLIDEAAARHGVTLRPQMEFDDVKTIEDFVQATGYVTLLPPITVHRALRAGGLRQSAIRPAIVRQIVCATSRSRTMHRPARLFVEELRTRVVEVTEELGRAIPARDHAPL